MDSAEPDLSDVVLEFVAGDESSTDDAALLVLAALEGEHALDDALGKESVSEAEPPRADAKSRTAEAAGAFVRSVRVAGFRGIGPEAELRLQPSPGLTIVAGRNGSGKSSFSEALELALTGDTYRWNSWVKKSTLWSEHWRNLHQGTPCEIRIDLAEEGNGRTTVGVDWADDAKLVERKTWVQRQSKSRVPGLADLGWNKAIELYRPFLSYEELGGILQAGPSTLFDKLDAILGVDRMNEAQSLLAARTKTLRATRTTAKAVAQQLKSSLPEFQDERAAHALKLLNKREPDVEAVLALAVGSGEAPGNAVAELKTLTRITLPSPEQVAKTVQDLRTAAGNYRRFAADSVEAATRRAELLEQALVFHDHEGDARCPVCGGATLDAEWRARAEAELAQQSAEASRRRRARHALDTAKDEAGQLIKAVTEPQAPATVNLAAIVDAHAFWQRWNQAPTDATDLANHLHEVYGELATAFELLREEAVLAWQAREDQWAPYAVELARWTDVEKQARAGEPLARRVETAVELAKQVLAQMREQALVRIEQEARRIWSALKQESNVGLGAIELKGSGTRRRVELRADVDGAEAQALGVMSQGELHALALALFLPRATMPGSPFRFVVLDDPVQAMDPAKIDGFVRVLDDLAQDRQVIVFSHDDRLPQAVREMRVNARMLEVSRAGNSALTVKPSSDPAHRCLSDAMALAKDPRVPDDVRRKVLPGLCRQAAESAAYDVYVAQRLSAGEARVDVEARWNSATTTGRRLALTVRGDMEADLRPWLAAGPQRQAGFAVVSRTPHEGLRHDPESAVHDVMTLVRDVRGVAR